MEKKLLTVLVLTLTIISIFTFTACAQPTQTEKSTTVTNSELQQVDLAIIGAMQSEVDYLIGKLENSTETDLYGYTIYSGDLNGKSVAIIKCGVGKVNAARGTQLVIDKFNPKAIVNTGVAGALAQGIGIGDAVVANGLVQHDFDITSFGHAPGFITGEDDTKPTVFTPDKDLAKKLKDSAIDVMKDNTVVEGIIATGDVFVANDDLEKFIIDTFNASAVEMEGGAIAQTAEYAGIPFAVLRLMSDSADGDAVENYQEFEIKAAEQSAKVIEKLLEKL